MALEYEPPLLLLFRAGEYSELALEKLRIADSIRIGPPQMGFVFAQIEHGRVGTVELAEGFEPPTV